VNINAERDARIDRLADHLRKSLDMNLIKSWIVDPSAATVEKRRA